MKDSLVFREFRLFLINLQSIVWNNLRQDSPSAIDGDHCRHTLRTVVIHVACTRESNLEIWMRKRISIILFSIRSSCHFC